MRFIARSLGELFTRAALTASHAAVPIKIGDGLHSYNVVKNEGGQIVFVKRVDFPRE
jgi:hypothetical protein